MNLSTYNANLRQALAEVNLNHTFKSLNFRMVSQYHIKRFPMLDYFPSSGSRSKDLDLPFSLFKWIVSNKGNNDFLEKLAKAIHPTSCCQQSSLELKGLFKKFCEQNNLHYAF